MLRHPAAVIDSKQRWYGDWQGDVARTAGWVQQTLFTERATRGAPRAFVRYEDLLDDWTRTVRGRRRRGSTSPSSATRPRGRCATSTASSTAGSAARAPDWGEIALPARTARAGRRGLGGRVDAARRRARIPRRRPGSTSCAATTSRSTRRPRRSRSRRSPPPRAACPAAPAARVPAPTLKLVRRVPRRYRHSVPPAWRGADRPRARAGQLKAVALRRVMARTHAPGKRLHQ